MPAASFRNMPARIISLWLTSSASAGSSFSVGMKAWERRMARVRSSSGRLERLLEGVEPGGLPGQEPRRPDRAAGEDGAIGDGMHELERLSGAGEDRAMNPRHRARAERRDPHLSARARLGDVGREAHGTSLLGQEGGPEKRGPAGGVALRRVMVLHDVDLEDSPRGARSGAKHRA